MSAAKAEQVIAELEGKGVKRVKIGVADIDGVLRGKHISFDKFRTVAKGTWPLCDCIFDWDVADQLYDNATFTGWHTGFPDAPVHVDLSTMRLLGGQEVVPLFLGELAPAVDEAFHPICPRNVLRQVVHRAETMGYVGRMGFEYEFNVFRETPHSIREKDYKNLTMLMPGMFGYSLLRDSACGEIYQGLMDYCIELDMPLESLHEETGPGVLEAAIASDTTLRAADKAVLFKTFSKVFFQQRGMLATFMAKWSKDLPGQSGHLHQSLEDRKTARPLFYDASGRGAMTELAEHFVAGQLKLMREFTAMIAPTINSYSRMVKGAWAPTAATWGIDNRTAALRVCGHSEKSQRVEYRLAAADGNPYLVAAAALASGLYGIEHELSLDDPVAGNAYDLQDSLPVSVQLPSNLRDAYRLFAESKAAREYFGDAFVDHFAASREWEVRQFEQAITDWELRRYFEII